MIEKIADIIRKGRNFLVTSHVRLDGDAVGSELALYEALRGLGKEAVVYNQDRTPQMYAFLPDAGAIVNRLGLWTAMTPSSCSTAARSSAWAMKRNGSPGSAGSSTSTTTSRTIGTAT